MKIYQYLDDYEKSMPTLKEIEPSLGAVKAYMQEHGFDLSGWERVSIRRYPHVKRVGWNDPHIILVDRKYIWGQIDSALINEPESQQAKPENPSDRAA